MRLAAPTSRRALAITALLTLACADPPPNQVLSTSDSCPVDLRPTLTLSGHEVGHTWTLAADADRVYVRPSFARHQISVFDREGRLVEVLGDEGEGPGEFRQIRAILPLDDGRLLVLDDGNARMTRLTADGQVETTHPLPVRPIDQGAELLLDSSLLVSGRTLASRAHAGHSLFHLSREGEILASFGGREGGDLEERLRSHTPRWVHVGPDGTIWSVDRHSALHGEPLTLGSWSLDGERLDSARLERDWFGQIASEVEAGVPERQMRLPPETQAVDIDVDGEGRLWLLVLVPDPEWEEGMAQEDPERTWDTVLEVWDPATRSSLCQIRRDEYFVRFLGDGQVASYRETGRGEPRVVIWSTGISP